MEKNQKPPVRSAHCQPLRSPIRPASPPAELGEAPGLGKSVPDKPGYIRRVARPCTGPLFSSSLRRACSPCEALAELASDPSIIGNPPAYFSELHRPAFVDNFWSRIRHCIENPVHVDVSLGILRVQVLGLVIFEHAPDGRIEAAEWILAADGTPERRDCTEDTGAVGVPYGDAWIERFRPAFAVELTERVGAGWQQMEP